MLKPRFKGRAKFLVQPAPSFAHPDNIRYGTAVAEGSVDNTFGTLNTPSIAYAKFSPEFQWNSQLGWIGGLFWDGRASNLLEQAGKPILNPVEMAMPSQWAVVSRLKENNKYVKRFLKLYDIDLDTIPSYELAPREVIPPPEVFAAFDAVSKAIAAFEKSKTFNKFNSKYDYVVAGMTLFNDRERAGFELFNGKAKCSVCHWSETTKTPAGDDFPALFSSFTYQNIGVPENVNIPGTPFPHEGIGGREDIAASDREGLLVGAFRVMSLRNIELTPPYMHNGALKSLEEVVHFYNTRDVKDRECDSINDPGFAIDCWPPSESSTNVITGLMGDLGLTVEEEQDIIAFLRTLTDNYPRWGNRKGLNDPNVPRKTPSPFDASFLP